LCIGESVVVMVVVAWPGSQARNLQISRLLVASSSQPASCLSEHRHRCRDHHALKPCLISHMPVCCGVVLSVQQDSWLMLLALIHYSSPYY
jgi:hypothetical protein